MVWEISSGDIFSLSLAIALTVSFWIILGVVSSAMDAVYIAKGSGNYVETIECKSCQHYSSG